MNFYESVRIALRSLQANRLRSLLTLLGIVIGVSTVITVVSFISGLNHYVAEKIFDLGADVFVVSRTPNVSISIDDWIEAQKRKSLTLDDMDAIQEGCDLCRSVGASQASPSRVKYGREFLSDTQIQGYTADLLEILGTDLEAGRGLTSYDVNHARYVAIIGADVAETLFPFVDPLGKTLLVNDQPFQVIGVGVKQGTVVGQSRDNWVVIPITVHQKMWGPRRSIRIYGKALSEQQLELAVDQARLIMRTRRHLQYSAKDDFALDTNENFLAIWANISRTFFAVTIGIAAISLVVGGIVVMNIMLVSVTERTREIGIRKATGARRADILSQFLVESSTLALVGGVIGVTIGMTIATVVSWVTPLPSAIQWWAVLLGLIVSTAVGLFFGIYPARKAAQLDPIEALRYE